MDIQPFNNVKHQIGFCGIWCGSCAVGNGALMRLTKGYEGVIDGYGLEGWAPRDFDFEEFKKGLSSIRAIPPCKGCLKGGGRPDCEMRACASEQNLSDCSECEQPTSCENLETLKRMRTGALAAGLMVKTDVADRDDLIEKWTSELKSKWPSCILFLNER